MVNSVRCFRSPSLPTLPEDIFLFFSPFFHGQRNRKRNRKKMSDDALTDDLVRYQILSKVTPGKIVVVDELGKWDITEPSRYQSGMRSVYNLVRYFRFPPSQRSVFLSHLERTTKSLISHCDLQMQTRVFDVCIKQQQSASVQDIEKFDQVMVKLKTICKALWEGMKALEMLCKTTPYQTDVNFAGEVDIRIVYHVKCFFQRVANAMGPVYSKPILGEALGALSANGSGNGNGNMNPVIPTGTTTITTKHSGATGYISQPQQPQQPQHPQAAIPLPLPLPIPIPSSTAIATNMNTNATSKPSNLNTPNSNSMTSMTSTPINGNAKNKDEWKERKESKELMTSTKTS